MELNEMTHGTLTCENCICNDGCERVFKVCVANFTTDKSTMEEFDLQHLTYCEPDKFNTLTEDMKQQFIQILYDYNRDCMADECNVI